MVAIVPCTPARRPAARALLAAQLDEHALPTDGLDAALDGALGDPSRAFVLLAEDDGQAIGVAYVAFTWTLEHGGKSAWLEELYVLPAKRNAGIGAQLLDGVLRECARQGCIAVDLEVEADHARAANLYARAGFRPHRRARWVKPLR